ncbi:MAG: hypothetical protein M3238_08100 [Actinomycetota bacterium]|nr:hypothetical protein [Actinomycetota bacterium]
MEDQSSGGAAPAATSKNDLAPARAGSLSDELRAEMGPFQSDLTKIPGVTSARVVGESQLDEIHIVATRDRSPKQIMRDVRSLAAAGYGLDIDHRIVSVAQVDGDRSTPESPARPVISWVYTARKGDSGRVDIGLTWPWGERAGGAINSSQKRDARARAGAEAVVEALGPELAEREAAVDIETVLIERFGATDWILVKARFKEKASATPVVGTAAIEDDIITSAARAMLHALNRKLEFQNGRS